MKVSQEALQALEFPFVRDLLAERTVTPMGRPLALGALPLPGTSEIASALDETDEARRLLEAEGGLPLRGVEPVEEIFAALARDGAVLTGREILAAVRFCEVAESARGFGRRVREAFPGLGSRASALPVFQPLVDAIAGRISPAGELLDSASPALARIRARIQAMTTALRQTLESILSRHDADKFLSDAFITQRGGRYVIPVRTDAPTPLKGIVHGGSSSGATLFIEPLATVETNNELVRLGEEETAEIERILRAWTGALAERRGELLHAAHELGLLDFAQAKGRLARDLGCERPRLGEGERLVLAGARHPLLEKTLAASGRRIVPVDVALPAGAWTLIVSGPNAGGKTVVLKTAGLLAMMAHSGLFVPAAEARLPLLRRILVDIGDRQSIEGSLSTFSAHIQNLAAMARTLDPPCLVLIDEIGTGTDPAEGGALAIALLEHLKAGGALTIATTHHGPVKMYGIETDGVASASVEFDEATLAPTFRVLPGIAGASAGLAIAERLGLPPSIVESARSHLDPGAREAEGYLLKLRRLVASLEEDRRELDRLRTRLEAESRRAREEAIRSDNERAESFRGELARELEEFREKARRSLGEIEARRESMKIDRERARHEAELTREVERIARAAAPAGDPGGAGGARRQRAADARGAEPAEFIVAPGASVLVGPYGRLGKVEEVEGDAVTVLVGAARFRVRLTDCAPPGSEPPEPRWKSLGAGAGRQQGSIDKGAVPYEINLIGLRVEEGLERLDKFLDDAFLAGRPEVRVIHGHGTGRLKRAVREALSKSPQIASHRPGAPNEGGDGATIATLAE